MPGMNAGQCLSNFPRLEIALSINIPYLPHENFTVHISLRLLTFFNEFYEQKCQDSRQMVRQLKILNGIRNRYF